MFAGVRMWLLLSECSTTVSPGILSVYHWWMQSILREMSIVRYLFFVNKHCHQDPQIQCIPHSWYMKVGKYSIHLMFLNLHVLILHRKNFGFTFISGSFSLYCINMYIVKANFFKNSYIANYSPGAHPVGWNSAEISIFWRLMIWRNVDVVLSCWV